MKILKKIPNALSWCVETLCNLTKKILNVLWVLSLQNIYSWTCSGFCYLTCSIKHAWKSLWSKTTIDEKIVDTAKETIRRAKATGKEIKDVTDAIGEVGNQIGDIPDALAGKKRRGRKPKNYQNNGTEKKKTKK